MKNEKDLRVRRSRDSIRAAFMELLQEKPVEAIYVSDICKKANCSRNAFYAHYPHKEALYNALLDECIRDIKYAFRPVVEDYGNYTDADTMSYAQNIINTIYTKRTLLIFLLQNNEKTEMVSKLDKVIFSYFCTEAENSKYAYSGTATYKMAVSYITSGTAGFLAYWLQETNLAPEEATVVLYTMMRDSNQVIASYLATGTIHNTPSDFLLQKK